MGHPLRTLPFVLSLLCVVATPAIAEPPKVVASILPVQSLVAGVMQGIGEPDLLVQGGASPHDFSFSPSAARSLQAAGAVFWVGPNVEHFLAKPLTTLSGKALVVPLSRHVHLLKGREGGAWETHDHGEEGHDHADHDDHDKHADHDDHEKHADHDDHDKHADHDDHDKHADHDHDKHDHDDHDKHADHDEHELDMHVWLDPGNAKAMVRVIVSTLQAIDAANTAAYAANGAALIGRLDKLDTSLKSALAPVKDVPFVVFHDAYQYFERHYGLNAIGSITVSPERSPGARRLIEIREKIHATGARCVFAEPQFSPALVGTVVEGTQARPGTLDPLGAAIAPGPNAYFTLMENLAKSLRDCLSRAS